MQPLDNKTIHYKIRKLKKSACQKNRAHGLNHSTDTCVATQPPIIGNELMHYYIHTYYNRLLIYVTILRFTDAMDIYQDTRTPEMTPKMSFSNVISWSPRCTINEGIYS